MSELDFFLELSKRWQGPSVWDLETFWNFLAIFFWSVLGIKPCGKDVPGPKCVLGPRNFFASFVRLLEFFLRIFDRVLVIRPNFERIGV